MSTLATPYQIVTLPGATFIRRVADQAMIPADPANQDYQAYLAWAAAGNTAPTVTS